MTKSILWDVSREELLKVANSSTSLNNILKYFDLSGSAFYTLKTRLIQEGFDLSIFTDRARNHLNAVKYTKELLTQAVKDSTSFVQVLRKLGLFENGNNYCHISSKIEEFGLNTSHFVGKTIKLMSFTKRHWTEYLVDTGKNRRTSTKILKRALIESGRKYECEECENDGLWNNKKLTLQVDHIDSNKTNNIPSNLRFLCPNCHTQTEGYAGKKPKVVKKSTYKTPDKIAWPCKEDLEKMVWSTPCQQLAKELKVSDRAIGKRCKKYGISKPPRGYWIKAKSDKSDLAC